MNHLNPLYFFDLSEFEHASLFQDCRFVWEILSRIKIYLNKTTLGKIDVEIPQGAYLENREHISIGEGTIVEPGAYIRGPCIIGRHCQVRHGAYIRGDLITGDKCVIGHDTETKNVIMLDGAQAGHFAYLGDTILGNRVNLGAGTKCANLKLDHKNISIHVDDQVLDTGLRKFGAIIGDDSQLGCNSVTNPGSLLGKQVFVYPCINIGGLIPSQHVIRPAQKAIITAI